MKFDFPNKIRSGYFVAFILLLFSYFLSISALIQLREQNEWVDHTHDVIHKLEVLNASIKDAEIGWRNYIMMGDERFLPPYIRSHEAVDSVFEMLAAAVKDNPPERDRVRLMRELISRKYEINREQMETFKSKPFQISERLREKTFSSKQLMDSIGLVSESIGDHENQLLNVRISKVNFYNIIVFWIIVAAGTVSVLLILYSLITFNMESRAKKAATLQAESYHDQLEKRVRELDNANRELIELRSLEKFTSTGQIARVIAHEVRNPLTNIDLSAGHLENAGLSQEDRKMFLDIISRNSKRINQLINELLTATKFSELKQEMVAVDELLDESLSEARDRLQLHHIDLEKNYAAGDIRLYVDRAQMKIALLNIIVNAIEAMTPETGVLRVQAVLVKECCEITIRDNGKGMDGETLSKVFDPYFTSKSKGNGLGLTNTQNIILNHKGRIQAFSTPGQGTRFVISLTVSPGHSPKSV